MDRWALEQAGAMLEAKAKRGHLSPTEEHRIREMLANGDATRALETLAAHDGTVDNESREFGEVGLATETSEFAERERDGEGETFDFGNQSGDQSRDTERENHDYTD